MIFLFGSALSPRKWDCPLQAAQLGRSFVQPRACGEPAAAIADPARVVAVKSGHDEDGGQKDALRPVVAGWLAVEIAALKSAAFHVEKGDWLPALW